TLAGSRNAFAPWNSWELSSATSNQCCIQISRIPCALKSTSTIQRPSNLPPRTFQRSGYRCV
ncbi:hypothetical protein BGZ70_004627, partial [Mortierella alpina]